MQVLVITLILFTNSSLFAQTSFRERLLSKATENVEVLEDKQLLELTDVKVELPSTSKSSDEKCLFLIHTDDNIQNVYDVTQNLNTLFEHEQSQCGIMNEIVQVNSAVKEKKGWNFSFHFGFTRTFYQPTDMKLQSSRVNVVIKDFEFEERTSAKFYNPQNWTNVGEAFRWIDEPTNHFVITAEKNGHSIILSIFHPKFLKKQYAQNLVTGTIDGVEVDGVIDINEPFDGYNNQVGEMYLVRFENTHLQMAWQVGYGYEIKLLGNEKYGEFSLQPNVLIGLMSGKNNTVYTQEGEYWEYDHYHDQNRIQGTMYSLGLKANYRIKNVNLFVEGKYSKAHLKHGFMDGQAEYDLQYTTLTFGVGYTIQGKKKKKIPKFD